MEKIITQIDSCKREIVFTFTKEELKPSIDKAFKELQPKVDLKGFRKGKVPIAMIEKLYGKQIEFDAVQDFTNELFNKVITEDKINIVGQGDLLDMKPIETGWKVKIAYEVVADFQLADYRGLEIEEPVHIVGEDEIEDELTGILNYFAQAEPADQVVDTNHIVTADINPLDDVSGLPIVGKSENSQIFVGDKNLMPELKEMLLNTKVDDSFIFAPNQSPTNKVKITITDIKKLVPPDYNNEWVIKMTGERLQTTEEYREDIAIRLQEQWNNKSRGEMENQIISKLVDANVFEVPGNLVENVSKAMAEDFKKRYKDIDSSFITPELYKDVAERTVRWELIRGKIIETEKLEIEDHDMDDLIDREVERTKGDREAIKNRIMNNTGILENILTKKVMDFILDFAITNEIPFDEYSAKSQQHEHDHNYQIEAVYYDEDASDEDHYHDHDHGHHHHDHDHNHDHHDHKH